VKALTERTREDVRKLIRRLKRGKSRKAPVQLNQDEEALILILLDEMLEG